MTDRREAQAEQVFNDVISVTDSKSRRAMLRSLCGADRSLQARVLALLAAHEEAADAFLRTGESKAPDQRPELGPGDSVGRYVLCDVLSRGGNADVFTARQSIPGAPVVALKVITRGTPSGDIHARFESERRMLSAMAHPNIAQVFDAGATEFGQPYIVMEYVDGESITAFADTRELSIMARLDLVCDVCSAIEHAHQKAIIHRDLKPSNILVADVDGDPVPKVIDFGIGKIVGPGDEFDPAQTQAGIFLGTPLYMSPEQAGAAGGQVDVRTDVYSLGVVLFELLCGATVLDAETLRSAGTGEMLRMIAEAERPAPSARLASHESAECVAQRRGRTVKSLTRLLQRDLDWIVSKAVAPDPAERYDDVRMLEQDIRRYLRHEPTSARPPSAAYRVRKFVRRNRVGTAVAGSLAFGVICTVAALVWALRARSELAERTLRLDRRNATLDRVVRHQSGWLAELAPSEMAAEMRDQLVTRLEDRSRASSVQLPRADIAKAIAEFDLTSLARDVLEKHVLGVAWRAVDRDFSDDVPIRVDRLRALGKVFFGHGLLAQSERVLTVALDQSSEHHGPEHARTLELCGELGAALRSQGKLAESKRLTERAFHGLQRVAGSDDIATLAATLRMGGQEMQEGNVRLAWQHYSVAHDGYRRLLGPAHSKTLRALMNLGASSQMLGKREDAARAYRQALDGFEATGGDGTYEALCCAANVGWLAIDSNDVDEAVSLGTRAWEGLRALRGEDHPSTVNAACLLGIALSYSSGQLRRAESVLRAAVGSTSRKLTRGHERRVIAAVALARVLRSRDAFEESLRYSDDALSAIRTAQPDHWLVGSILVERGVTLAAMGRVKQAEVSIVDGYQVLQGAFGDTHVKTTEAKRLLGALRSSGESR